MSESIPFRTIVQLVLIGILTICVVGYIIFQARFLIMGPQISLTEEPPTISNERQIALVGSAQNISRLWLNDRQIYTDAQGNFTEALVLENGYTVATLRAEDRYGRKAVIKRTIVYTPSSFLQ